MIAGFGALMALAISAQTPAASRPNATPANGPLRVHPINPRYFTDGATNRDGSLRAIYLTGSHVHNNLQDMGETNPPPAFDFEAYLDFLERHHHKFIRLWHWELPQWTATSDGHRRYCAPYPWPRTGPGLALDGQPKFNLHEFNPDYFRRLRARVSAARDRGIYTAIMLFEGWSLQFVADAWSGHPFNPANNVNGVGVNLNGARPALEIQTLANPAIIAVQEAYVRRVIETVNDLDNVLYEISNESHPRSTDWQYHMIQFIRKLEAAKPKQHPVGMTFQYEGGSNAALLNSPADWISPGDEGDANYSNDPPAAPASKVSLLDTDHLAGANNFIAPATAADHGWVWKSLLRGHNPILMDSLEAADARRESARRAMGHTQTFAERINLAANTPQPKLASTRYCLANPGAEYLIYQPKGGEDFSVKLSAGTYRYEWFNPAKGEGASSGNVQAAGGGQRFKAPFAGDAVLYLKIQKPGPERKTRA